MPDEHETRSSRRRTNIAVATLWVPFIFVAATWLTWRTSLPPDLPRQYNAEGVASTIPTWIMIGGTGLLTLAAAVAGLFALPGAAGPNRKSILLASGLVAGLAGSAWLITAGVQVAAGPSSEPAIGGWPLLAILAAGYGLIPFLILPRWEHEEIVYTTEDWDPLPPSIEPWSATVTSPLFGWTLAILVVIVAVGGFMAIHEAMAGLVAVIAVLTGVIIVLLAFVRLRVSIDSWGLMVTSTLLRLNLKGVRAAAISEAHAEQLSPRRWGGWGYRFTREGSAIISRKGDGLVLTLRNGKKFSVSVDNAEQAAGTLTRLISGRQR